MFFEKLKSIFKRKEIPQDARDVYERSKTTRELLKGLDGLLTRNEVEFRELSKEISAIETKEKEEEAKVKEGKVTGRQKRNALLFIRRLRKQLDNLDHRLRIYDRNMNLHLSLIGKIQDMEAMELRGVKEEEIDEILLDFEAKLEDYADTVTAASVVDEGVIDLDTREERELNHLEKEILGEVERPAEEEKEEGEKEKKAKKVRKQKKETKETQTKAPQEAAPLEEERLEDSPEEMELE